MYKNFSMLIGMLLLACVAVINVVHAANADPKYKLAPKDKQVLVRQLGAEPASIDPQLVEETEGSTIAGDLFEGLFIQDQNGGVAPAGAVSYTLDDTQTVYTFRLRSNLKWSNGDLVTANDYVYSWQRLADPNLGSNYAGYLKLINIKNADLVTDGKIKPDALGIKAIDDQTLQVTLSQPTPHFIKTLAMANVGPAPRKIIEKYGRDWVKPENIVSNGAYILEQWRPNEKMVLKKNPLYWDQESTQIEEVTYLVINNDQAAYNRYRAGELHFSTFPDHLLVRLKKEIPEQVINAPSLSTYYYGMDTTKKPFNDARVRTALSYAIDREIITEKVLGQGQLPAYSFVPPYTAQFQYVEPTIAKLSQKERVAKARALLKEAGYGPENPLDFELLYNTSEGHKKIAVSIANMWKVNLGAKIRLNNMEWKTMLSRLDSGDYDMYRTGWNGDYNDAMTFLGVFSKYSDINRTKWSNPEYDQLLQKAQVIVNDQERNSLYQKAEQILAQESPLIPIYFYVSARLLNPKLKGFPYENPMSAVYTKDLYFVK